MCGGGGGGGWQCLGVHVSIYSWEIGLSKGTILIFLACKLSLCYIMYLQSNNPNHAVSDSYD